MLELVNLSKSFGRIQALKDVSFSVSPGEVVAVVGENGAGKSTLVRCVARTMAPDAGQIILQGVPLGKRPKQAIKQGVSTVWQDLALCENLDVTANLFLGRELQAGGSLQVSKMRAHASQVFERLKVDMPGLDQPIHRLSGGQRQLVAIARATLRKPKVLVLDEPTSALGVRESNTVLSVIRKLQSEGVSVILVSHQLDEVFRVSDRIIVLRHGQCVADLYRTETGGDEVVALMTGMEAESTARQQLRRLHSLSEQLTEADANSVLPLTVASLSDSLNTNKMAIFLPTATGEVTALHCTATLNLDPAFAQDITTTEFDTNQGFLGRSVVHETLEVVPSLPDVLADSLGTLASSHGIAGAWSAPIVGQDGTIAVIVGFTEVTAHLNTEQKQLLKLFSSMAGAAIDRGELAESLRVNVRSLEGLQGVLEVFTGPDIGGESISAALEAVCLGIECDAAGLYQASQDQFSLVASSGKKKTALPLSATQKKLEALSGTTRFASFSWTRGHAMLVAFWVDQSADGTEAQATLDGAANSFRLAMERQVAVDAENEAITLREKRTLEQTLTRRLGHELRTPLTAIQGFSSTLLNDDVEWPPAEQRRFIQTIEAEAARLNRLVTNLFDASSMEAGTFGLNRNYCNVAAAIDRAIHVANPRLIERDIPATLVVWGDGDRLEQVFINLFSNTLKHGDATTVIEVKAFQNDPENVTIVVSDSGPGLPLDIIEYLNDATNELASTTGFGTRIIKGFVHAHDGTIQASNANGAHFLITLPVEPAL